MEPNFDLFGLEIDPGHGKPGRPRHTPTPDSRNQVMQLLALRWDDDRISKALNVSKPTLNKYYFCELAYRHEAKDRLDATRLNMLWHQMLAGNVAAMKEYNRIVEKNDLAFLDSQFQDQMEGKTPPPLGKKEAAALEAESAGVGTKWDMDLIPDGQRPN